VRGHRNEPFAIKLPYRPAPLELFFCAGCGLPFSVEVCSGCARTTWTASEIDELRSVARELREAERGEKDRPCACGARAVSLCTPVRDIRGSLLRLGETTTVLGARSVGTLLVETCDGCGAAEWFARDFAKLEANGREVVRVFGKDDDAGPYR
jgi:hypothetical protein